MEKTKTWKNALLEANTKLLAITNQETVLRELGFASQIIQASPKLQECSYESILNACINIGRTKITLNPIMKLAYLVPRKGKCVLDFDYRGLIKILTDSGAIKTMAAFIVYEDEVEQGRWDYDPINNKAKHLPIYSKSEAEEKKRIKYGAYSRAILHDGYIDIHFVPTWKILKIKDSSKINSEFSPWETWEDQKFKKTALRQHWNVLPKGNMDEAVLHALAVDHENSAIQVTKSEPMKDKLSKVFDEAEDVTNVPQEPSKVQSNKKAPKPEIKALDPAVESNLPQFMSIPADAVAETKNVVSIPADAVAEPKNVVLVKEPKHPETAKVEDIPAFLTHRTYTPQDISNFTVSFGLAKNKGDLLKLANKYEISDQDVEEATKGEYKSKQSLINLCEDNNEIMMAFQKILDTYLSS